LENLIKGKDSIKNEDSLKKRYFYKLSANFLGLATNVVIQAVIPRGLGPAAYGNFNFLTNFFNQILSFFDSGTSGAFYTKLSKRQGEFKLTSFYLYFVNLVALLVIGFVIITRITGVYPRLYPDQSLLYVYLAAIFAILTWETQVINMIADAYALTVSVELFKMFQKVAGLVVILILYFQGQINLTNIFFYNYFILLLLLIACLGIINRHGYSFLLNFKLKLAEIKKYIAEFYKYSHPLFIYSIIGLIAGIFDRWLLQIFAGSSQQGFYSLSYQIGAACFLFSSAMAPLITREFSIAEGNSDRHSIAVLFRKHIPLLYSITACIACFIAVNVNKVTLIMGGNNFKEASLAVAIMAFYPIHQTYGQLSSSVFFATDQTRLYRNIGIIFMLISLPVTYFLIAPNKLYGLNAGSVGLAIKMVLMQFLATNTQLYFNAKLLKLSFWRYFGHQIISISVFIIIAVFSSMLIGRIAIFDKKILASLFCNIVIYILFIVSLGYNAPVIFGLNRQDVSRFFDLKTYRIKG